MFLQIGLRRGMQTVREEFTTGDRPANSQSGFIQQTQAAIQHHHEKMGQERSEILRYGPQ